MDTISPDFKVARRRARQYEHPHLDTSPAYYRKHLRPRVQLGCMRDPAQPIEVMPSVHTPPAPVSQWRDTALWAASCVAVVVSFAVVGW